MTVQPATGFQVASVHSIDVSAITLHSAVHHLARLRGSSHSVTNQPVNQTHARSHKRLTALDADRLQSSDVRTGDRPSRCAASKGDDATADAAERFAQVATGRLTALSDHLDEWLAALPDAAKTKAMKRAEVLKLERVHTYAQHVDAKAASKWLADMSKGGAVSAKTVGRILSFVRGYWKHLREQGVVTTDPFVGLSPPTTARRRASWVPLSPAQVVNLQKRASNGGDHELADLISLGMWSGARIEELCSLEITNVHLKTKAFRVIDAKTEAGIREVPIHMKLLPTLRRLMGNRQTGYILTALKPNKFGDRSNAIGKRFGRLKRASGFGEGHVLHSIRKTVVTLLENAGVSENTAADIVGHEKPRITYGLYSSGATLEVKRAALSKLRYPT